MNYYVATDGNDANLGTLANPWLTPHYGFNHISAGDNLYIRGGTYYLSSNLVSGMYCGVVVSGKNGSAGNLFTVAAYYGETPIFNGTNITGSGERYGIALINSSYWHIKGIKITQVRQDAVTNGGQGLILYSSSYNTIEQVDGYVNGGPGLGMRGDCEENHFINCDAYNNWDAYSGTPGDNADGFDLGFITYRAGSDRVNYLKGCRAWGNGDDGFDMYQMNGYHGIYVLENCWAWKNGYRPDGVTTGGNGCGFKYGDDNAYGADAVVRRTTTNCIAYANRTRGFSQESADVKMIFYNNIAYQNGLEGFNFVTYNLADILKNNISYDNGSADVFQAGQTHDRNSWDSAVTVTDADFASVNDSSLTNARVSGVLPVITFLHLVVGSDLVGAGTGVGVTLDGDGAIYNSPPSMGPFEYGAAPPPVVDPVTSITVNSPYDVITTNDGALQMTVIVLPYTADVQTVTWSVIPGTGSAVITEDGYLQAVTNGTVTVRATAQDGSGVFGEKVITISNQLAALPAPTANALYNWWAVSKHIETNSSKNIYGGLYNWYAVNTGLLAPAGWHVPTDAEWDTLRDYLGGWSVAGGELKESGFIHWLSPNTGADNTSGFTAIGTGYRSYVGAFSFLTEQCNFLSSTSIDGTSYAYKSLNYNTSIFGSGPDYKISGNPVRLIKDDAIDPGTLIDIDGNVYNTVTIGTQVWMKSNLRVEHYNNGTLIPNITDTAAWIADTSGAMCYYNNTPTVVSEYLLPPIGWHVPTKDEFDTLVAYLGGGTVAGGHLKEIGLTYWNSPNTGADDSSGFTLLGNGIRNASDGSFQDLKNGSALWSNTQFDVINSYYEWITSSAANAYEQNDYNKYGFSVRFIKDNSIDSGTVTDFDGNIYPTVKIGSQVWMKSNFVGTHFNNGDPIPMVTDNAQWAALTTEAMSYYNNEIPVTPPTTGDPPGFEIYISETCSLTYQVFPLNFLSTTLVDELENGKIFYRRKFNGALIFGSNSLVKDIDGNVHNRCDDWDLFWGFEQTDPCARLYIQINKIVNGVVYPYWDGYFSTTDGKWDIDRQLFEITPTVNDEYSLLLEDSNVQHDILVNTPEVSTSANDGIIIQTYTHNHWLSDIMTFLINPGGSPAITVLSDFFTEATNYATGAANKLTQLTLAQKSDVKYPIAPNPAHFPESVMSWDELMEILKGMFQVYWIYDSLTETIHVEHISWFTANDGLDLRTQALCVATNKYSYVKEKMPKYEEFKFMEADNVNFVGVPIRYDSGCVDQNNETNRVTTAVNVSTDIEFIYNSVDGTNDDNISNDGWVMFQNSGVGPIYVVDMELGVWNAEVKLNMHLAWCNLHKNYFMHNRVVIEGFINNSPVTFLSAQKTRKQECSAIVCIDYDPDDNITTELGETYFSGEKARVDRAEIHPFGEIKFSLLYGTHFEAVTPPPPVKWVLVELLSEYTGCHLFNATLSEAAPVGGLNIEIRYQILSQDPTTGICGNEDPWDVWNIPEGETYASFDLTLGCEIPAGGCIYYYRVTVTPGDWTLSFDDDTAEECKCH